MPNKKNQPNSPDGSKKGEFPHNSINHRCKAKSADLKPICFENSMAAKASEEDIIRACSLFNKTQTKIINFKIAQIYFN